MTGDLDTLQFRGLQYTWVVPDDADTNVNPGNACAYDRIVFRNGTAEDFTGQWGIDRVFSDTDVSDHWPVWAEFFTGRDGVGVDSVQPPPPTACCRTCTTSQACGDACIPAQSACHQPPGCACQGGG